MLLAIDTCTAASSIALFDTAIGEVQYEYNWKAGRNHAAELLPLVQKAMEQAGLLPASLTGVAVSIGPGSFNGVRVGVTTAKVIAAALKIPIAGVDSLQVTAYPHFPRAGTIRPLLDAGRGRYCTTVYRKDGSEWVQVAPFTVVGPADLREPVNENTLFCGEIKESLVAELLPVWGPLADAAIGARGMRRAGCLAEMAWARVKRGQGDDPATLQAIYIPRPEVPAASCQPGPARHTS